VSTPRTRQNRPTSTWPFTVAEQARLTGTRLRDAWASLLGRFPWQWFVTLTFEPSRIFPVRRRQVEREGTWLGQLVAKVCRTPVGWVCAPERGRGGLWHGHMLMLGASETWSPDAVLPAWQARNGRIDLQRVTDQAGIALYITKDAAEAGTIVLSDTLARYRQHVGTRVVVPLWPARSEGRSR